MDDVTFEAQADAEDTDRPAIIMMLTYVEAECRRLGEAEAAHHAALAAALVSRHGLGSPSPEPCPRRCLPTAAALN